MYVVIIKSSWSADAGELLEAAESALSPGGRILKLLHTL